MAKRGRPRKNPATVIPNNTGSQQPSKSGYVTPANSPGINPNSPNTIPNVITPMDSPNPLTVIQDVVSDNHSYADAVREEEGITLDLIPCELNGRKCAVLDKTEIQKEINHWKTSIICCVLGANPPFKVMEGFIKRVWGRFQIVNIMSLELGHFIVQFADEGQCNLVLNSNKIFFDKKLVLLKQWNGKKKIDTTAIKSVPIWVQYPELDPIYWSGKNLSILSSMIGKPIKTDRQTKERSRLGYARVLIEVKIDEPLSDEVEMVDENDVLINQKVEYEWRPIQCEECKMYGHDKLKCRKKKKAPPSKPVWQPTQNQQIVAMANQKDQQTQGTDEEGFQIARRTASQQRVPNREEVMVQNQFAQLVNDENEVGEPPT